MPDPRKTGVPYTDAEARLAAIIDHADDAIVSKDLNGVITSWNQAAHRMFGYTAEEAIGRPITLIIPPDRRSEEAEILRRIRAGQVVDHFETIRVRKDGTFLEISVTISPVKDGTGRIVGASKIARDITPRKRLEQQQQMLFAEIQKANRAKDEFLAMLGHELRNPIGAINTAVHFLDQAGPKDDATAFAVDVISRQVIHLTRLVDDLLDVGRVVTGKIILHRRTTEMSEIVSRAINAIKTSGKATQHAIIVETSPAWVDGDEVRIEQIVTNLVLNALKYTPPGGTVRVVLKYEGPKVVLEVEDNGIGIARDLLDGIFDLFVQADRAVDRSQGGLGIGLTLVRRIVDLHGGTVEAFSEGPGRGSRFTVRLPAAKVAAPHKPAAPARKRSRGRSASVSRKILIVEDNQDAREMLRRLLELSGHRVFDADNGAAGVELALSIGPDLALIDVGLPEMDGYQVARRIREHPECRDILLAAMTGYGMPEDRQRALEAGFNLHLVKPVDPDKIRTLLESAAQPLNS